MWLFWAFVSFSSLVSRIPFINPAKNRFCNRFDSADFRSFLQRDDEPIQPINSKHSIPEHRDQYYATVRKAPQSPCRDSSSALERIPEYSEDIYPYATFHLPDQENFAGNPNRHGHSGQSSGIYDARDTLSMKQVCILNS